MRVPHKSVQEDTNLKKLLEKKASKAQWLSSLSLLKIIVEMRQDQVSMKPQVRPNLSWNLCLLGLWAAHKDLLQVFQRICRDNQAQHNIPQIMPQLI